MNKPVRIDGRRVAAVTISHPWRVHSSVDDVHLFWDGAQWTVLTIAYEVRADPEEGDPTDGYTIVTTDSYSSFGDLEAEIRGRYTTEGWDALLDAADRWSWHPALRQAWTAYHINKDFWDKASMHYRDLAVAIWSSSSGQVEAVEAPGRAVNGWESHYLDVMAERLTSLGYTVTERLAPGPRDEAHTSKDPLLGKLRVRRYEHEAVGWVRVDPAGEVFVRLVRDDDDEPVVTPIPIDDEGPPPPPLDETVA